MKQRIYYMKLSITELEVKYVTDAVCKDLLHFRH
jgi:hypothetical protein